ncbi:MAG: hypothetical protein WDW38_011201 [Sanguina aurantia]
MADAGVGATQCYDGLSFGSHMIAGGVAGTVEHVFMYPVDTIKTRMQALSHPGQRLHNMPVHKALEKAFRREGLRGLYKGVGAVLVGAGPAHAMHFAVYELAKESLGGNREGLQPLATGLAGAVATITNDALMTPADVVKQRMQVAHTPYTGAVDCIRTMLRTEGVRAFYKSYPTTLLMNIPFTAVHFTVYEAAKKVMMGKGAAAPSASAQARPPSNSSSGGGGGSRAESSSSSSSESCAAQDLSTSSQPSLPSTTPQATPVTHASPASNPPVPSSLVSWSRGRSPKTALEHTQNPASPTQAGASAAAAGSAPSRDIVHDPHQLAVADGSSPSTPPLSQTAGSQTSPPSSQALHHSFPPPHSGLHSRTSGPSAVQQHPDAGHPSHQRQRMGATGDVVGIVEADLRGDDEGAEETLAVQLVAGGVAGGCASAITTPFDVVKTRLQTEGVGSARRYNDNVVATMRRIVADEGMSALWRGLRPRVLFHVPSAAVCFGTYETIKSFLASEASAGQS